ncbi:hypothetical protein MINTM005_15630 [Mycobacterium intracellulare]|uniref:Uncharacterized protein n=1 Tax=Mycobacterium intracellulare TaxID=1767 RepID=A0A7R7MRJ7_MYCIT|nr:hypothetical protein MINTM005_15630 [Mycobacterium intracellulare]BCO77842.1 hypothetical protein MINTM009_16240 [Mycobacterium intracellulare]BCO98694.1 hypothetical protein MINTM018_14640 [Mycobacterium intracellulare]BCP19904.1 hypothetical protein MINTM023_16930 [Mycobacterium intracellulare]BCP25238.1 hypothetical protein MINTM025_15940 [Mycobacterium intracellulare]
MLDCPAASWISLNVTASMPRVANSRSATSINITRVDSPDALRLRAPAADSVRSSAMGLLQSA